MTLRQRYADEAVSESIGFIIIFGLVVTGIALVSLYGYPMLLKQQISSDERTMEQTMLILQNDMKLLSYSNVPYKDTSLRVSGGGLNVFNTTDSQQSFTIRYWNETGGYTETLVFRPGELRYTSSAGNAVISLENGAILKRQQDATGSIMIAEPRWFYDATTQTYVIFLLGIQADRPMALSGIGNIQMSRIIEPTVISWDYAVPRNVSVRYTADPQNDYSLAWENYFTGSGILAGGLTPLGTEYDLANISKFVLKAYVIRIEHI
ncbi:MAG: hypothetical protein GKC04_07220 [Methanomicrobiales archaeon]|nr:hypothetical protein [Methanomicrobiales archaeon]